MPPLVDLHCNFIDEQAEVYRDMLKKCSTADHKLHILSINGGCSVEEGILAKDECAFCVKKVKNT